MLTIVGPYPTIKNERDGMVRRVSAIDDNLKSFKRRYLTISFKGPIYKVKKIDEHTTVYWLNFFLLWWYAFYLCMRSEFIYVHSIYNSLYILPVYFFNKYIITDMHGVVVEEIKMNQKHSKPYILLGVIVYKTVEFLAVKNSKFIICVTNKMRKYFTGKYHIKEDKIKILPIFDTCAKTIRGSWGNPMCAIYSGGIQPWQCIDDTIKYIKDTSNLLKWVILSNDSQFFKEQLSGVSFKYGISIESVSPNAVGQFYEKCDFGIVLRDKNIVNEVACPTKLIDYLNYGLIPIVKDPDIGDFKDAGYYFIDYRKPVHLFMNSQLLDLTKMRKANYTILEEMILQANSSINWLKYEITDKCIG